MKKVGFSMIMDFSYGNHGSENDQNSIGHNTKDENLMASFFRIGYSRLWEHCQIGETEVLWRFMPIDRFFAMLESTSIWMSRTDKFEDKLEGKMPRKWAEKYAHDNGLEVTQVRDQVHSHMKMIYASCWYKGEIEPAGMWGFYGKSNCVVAIKSTASQIISAALNASLQPISGEVTLGSVRYFDYENEVIEIPTDGNSIHVILQNLWAHFLKRNSFKHEQEARLAVFIPPPDDEHEQPNGFELKVDLDKLLNEIVVSPHAMSETRECLKKLIETYGIQCDVKHSRIFIE